MALGRPFLQDARFASEAAEGGKCTSTVSAQSPERRYASAAGWKSAKTVCNGRSRLWSYLPNVARLRRPSASIAKPKTAADAARQRSRHCVPPTCDTATDGFETDQARSPPDPSLQAGPPVGRAGTMDQDAFRQTYREVNKVYCAFEKSVLTINAPAAKRSASALPSAKGALSYATSPAALSQMAGTVARTGALRIARRRRTQGCCRTARRCVCRSAACADCCRC